MSETKTLPPQHQDRQPGHQDVLHPQPQTESRTPGSNRLKDRVVLVTGGDSGIGRAVAVLAAKEGADVAIGYLEEDDDAQETRQRKPFPSFSGTSRSGWRRPLRTSPCLRSRH
jgi:FlaA1/EpsC-like NDP-sugar epimerase